MLAQQDIEEITRKTVAALAPEPHVTQATRYWDDLRWDKVSRETVYGPSVAAIEDLGEGTMGVVASDLQKDVSVGATSRRLWKGLLLWRSAQP